MPANQAPLSRRDFVWQSAMSAGALAASPLWLRADNPQDADKALIAITLDLEMSRNFPTWEQTHWDYEKGNLNAETKAYAVEAARRVKKKSGVVHFFLVGQALEQENIDWLKEIARNGHPIGNHTYDHVHVKAKKPEDIQFRFRRSPWLIAGQTPAQVIRENIRLTNAALKSRVGIEPAGFRTPGGFSDGLADRPDLQRLLLDLGFAWVSSKYPAHPVGEAGAKPAREVIDKIQKAQTDAQPFVYPSGLIEVPMSPISDITAFRAGRWKLDYFLEAIRASVEWAISRRAVFVFLGHPSCLYVTDPEFRAIDLICDLVRQAKSSAALVDLQRISKRTKG